MAGSSDQSEGVGSQTDLRRKLAATSPEIYHRLIAAAIRLFRCIVRETLSASAFGLFQVDFNSFYRPVFSWA